MSHYSFPIMNDMSAVDDFSIPPPPPTLDESQDVDFLKSQSPPPLLIQASCDKPCSQLALPATPPTQHELMETDALSDQPNTSPVIYESPTLSTRTSTPTLSSQTPAQPTYFQLRSRCRKHERRIEQLEDEIAMRKAARDKMEIETDKEWARMNRVHDEYCRAADSITKMLVFQVDYLERDLEDRVEQVSTCAPDPASTPCCEFKDRFGQTSYVLRNHLSHHRSTRRKVAALETQSYVLKQENKRLRQLVRDKNCSRPNWLTFTDIDME